MATNLQSSSPNNADSRASFRKPLNDAASRKYRRRSPANGSSSSDGSPDRQRGFSPNSSREAPGRVSDYGRSKDDRRALDRDRDRSQYGRDGDRHSGRYSSRSYHRHDDHARHERHAEEEERNYSKLSSHSGRESRGGDRSDHARRELRDHSHDVDKYSRDKSGGSGHRSRERDRRSGGVDVRDDKMDHRSLGDHRSDRVPLYEESGGHRNDSAVQGHSSRHRSKEASRIEPQELSGEKNAKVEKKKYDGVEIHKERHSSDHGEEFEGKTISHTESQQHAVKKPKFMSSDRVSKFSTIDDERQTSTSKQAAPAGKFTTEKVDKDTDLTSDIDAAKVAAIKAAELVNKNLIGTGYLSTDQKKKLLWGNKKSATADESGHRWDATLFPDRERQEKFNKLMGVKGELKVEQKPDNHPDAEKQKELQQDLEKQYTAGLRRRDGRTVGLGL